MQACDFRANPHLKRLRPRKAENRLGECAFGMWPDNSNQRLLSLGTYVGTGVSKWRVACGYRVMPVRAAIVLLAMPLVMWAQPLCPSISFVVSHTLSLKPTQYSHIDAVRQSDGSYTGFEVGDVSPYPVYSATPHLERQFAACLPHTLPVAPASASSSNVIGVSSQLVASEHTPFGGYFVASINGNPYGGSLPIQFDLYDSQLSLISETSFADPGSYGFRSLAMADVNGDGTPDLIGISLAQAGEGVYSLLNVGRLWVFVGNGDGTFQTGVVSSLPGNFFKEGYTSFVAADLNRDGKTDLALTGAQGVTTIAIGKGDGTFTFLPANAVATLPTTKLPLDPVIGPASIAAADLNGDGKLDLAFGPFSMGDTPTGVAIAMGNGDGTFQTPAFFPARLSADAVGANQIALGDVNQDGIPDLVTSGGTPVSFGVTILFGDGKGGFSSRRDYDLNGYYADGAGSVNLFDFDGDGIADIVLGNGSAVFLSYNLNYPGLTVLFGKGGGAFVGAPIVNSGTGSFSATAQAIAAADFDGDGIPDLADTSLAPESLTILKGSGDGNFAASFRYAFPNLIPVSLATADFDRDGKQDVAALVQIPMGVSSPGEVQIFLGNGDGALQTPASLPFAGVNPTDLVAADLNGDGIPDLAATAQGGVWLWLGKGDGTFSEAAVFPVSGATLTSLVVGDFNGDGKADLAVANQSGKSVAILIGKGDGTFSTGNAIPVSVSVPVAGGGQTALGPTSLIAADFNGDGALDLAATMQNANGIAVLLGKGDGNFQGPAIDPEAAVALAAAGINGDKIADLVVADASLGTVVRPGSGDGTFLGGTPVVSSLSRQIAIADFNGDGKPDVAGSVLPSGVAVLLNLSTPPSSLAVVSAASFLQGPLAPNEIASAFGTDLATLGFQGTTVSVHDSAGSTRSAFVYYAAAGQANFVIPAQTALGAATVTLTAGDGHQSATKIQIVPLAPGLDTVGTAGIAAAYAIRVNPDLSQTVLPVFAAQGSSVTPVPIDLSQPGQVYLLLFGTGFDAASAASTDVTIQGIHVPVQYAGPQLSFAGFDQIGVLLPPSLAGSGLDAVQATIGGVAANRVYISIQ
jgi:uncharacterized protein (TIGR03437 family)